MPTIILLAIILLAFALRVWDIANLRMWGDEGFSVYSAHRDLYAITFEGKDVDPHPPLYYYLLHFWLPLAGFSEFSVRFFSIFFGIATVAMIYAIGKRLFDPRVGVIASALIAIAPFAIHYSQEARMYALVIFLGAIAMYVFARLIEKETRVRWIGFWIAMFLAQYTLYQTAFLFITQGLTLAPLLFKRFAFVARWLVASISIVILFLPWLALHSASAYTDVKGVAGDTIPMDVWTFLARGFAGLILDPTVPFANALPFVAIFFGLIVIGLAIALATRAAKLADALLALNVIIPLIAMYPLYILLPLYRGRLFALALVPMLILIARAFALIARRVRWWSAPIAIALIAAFAFGLNHYYFRYQRYSAVVDDYISAIRALEKIAQPGDVVLFHAYWHEGYFLSDYHGAPLRYGGIEKETDLQNAIAQSRNVWAIVQALDFHPAENWLAQNAFYLGEQKYGQMRVIAYRADAMPSVALAPIAWNNGIALIGARVEARDNFVWVRLDWQAAQKLARDFTISVRVTDARGDVIWTQADSQPASGASPTSTWEPGQTIADRRAIAIPAGTPPGEYTIRALMYDAQTGAPALAARGDSIAVGTITFADRNPLAPTASNLHDAIWDDIELVDATRGVDAIAPGDALPITLLWRARLNPTRDYRATIQVVDSSGIVRATTQYLPANDLFTTRVWNANQGWIDKRVLRVDAEAVGGDAGVRVIVDDRAVEVARIQINTRPHRFDPPTLQFAKTATLGNAINLLGFDLDADAIKSRATIPLTLHWQALEKMSERYTVFAHLIDASGNIIAQHDREPDNARTTSWLRDEVIADHFEIALPENLAPGEYTLVAGMYHAPTGTRLAVKETNADQILLTKIRVPAR